MNIAVGGLFHETNTFVALRTELPQFQRCALLRGGDIVDRYRGTEGTWGGIIDRAEALGVRLSPALYAEAVPGGVVEHASFLQLAEELVASLDAGADGILLVLHGAMVTSEEQDAEGWLLRRCRERFGPDVPIVCTIDLHANVSPEMVTLSHCLVGYDTYPHTDYYPRAVEAVDILHGILLGDLSPTSSLYKPSAMPAVQSMLTDAPPMNTLIDLAHRIEKEPGVVNVTITGGFPYADVYWAGMGFIVTTNGDPAGAKRRARDIGRAFEAMERQFAVTLPSPDEGVVLAKASNVYPVVLVDSSDNVGGGSSGDGTDVLAAILRHGLKPSVVMLADPEAVLAAIEAGIGGLLSTKVGGKTDRLHGDSVAIRGTVARLSDGHYRSERTGEPKYMGLTAVVDCDGVYIVLTTERVPAFDLAAIESVGLHLKHMRYIAVKGAVQWKSSYGRIARASVEVDAAGVTSASFRRFRYARLRSGMFPIER
ncbi:M81 family metallopeptidase [Paenibacillus antri]|uniref:M81 family metallopeptidase n=1 Tax=Paenibacillus antri TaxID=2582848 RepID=A0A5R9G547_9BACL|nr:M81 family metallopeptidase [Paenibacillus antri]TLS51497.1 M81 family metallopeptidase [Paenibacillus antri]